MTRLENMLAVDRTVIGEKTAAALAKWGEITVGDPETWPSFCEEIGADDLTVATALHALRFRGYAWITLVKHPAPPSPYCPWTRHYAHTGKQLPPEIVPLIDAEGEPTEAMRAARERAKTRALEALA
jgi:hypothetical protein